MSIITPRKETLTPKMKKTGSWNSIFQTPPLDNSFEGCEVMPQLNKKFLIEYRDIAKKWNMPVRNWSLAIGHFSIIFEHQLHDYL